MGSKMVKTWRLVLFLGVLAPVDLHSQFPVEAPTQSPARAIVYVYRQREDVGEFQRPSIFRDGVEIARMRNGRYFEMLLVPGTYKFSSNMRDNEFVLNLEAGRRYYLRVEMKQEPKGQRGIASHDHGKMTAVLPEQGLQESSVLNPADRGDLLKGCGCDLALPR
jgi:hypothetical protein